MKIKLEIWMVLLLTLLAFAPGLNSGWVNEFDEGDLLHYNDHVKKYKPVEIFTQSNTDTYVPITTLSFAVQYQIFKDDPRGYHLTNLLLHLLVVYLLYLFIFTMGFAESIAVMAALIFAIHPMHVESVAWVVERKDLLYSAFYLMGLIMYIKYLLKRTGRFWWFCFAACILSVLSKPMALSFPLVLMLIDWYYGRSFTLKTLAEKIPFFLAVGIISLVTFINIDKVSGFQIGRSALLWVSSCMFYPAKFFWPVNLSPLYLFPRDISLLNPYYAINATAFLAVVCSVIIYRNKKLYVFACLYYFLSTFFLYRFNLQDYHNVADRFMYLPSLGICLFLACLVDRFKFSSKYYKHVGFIVFCVSAYMWLATIAQTQVWKSEKTMWAQILKQNSHFTAVHEELAQKWRDAGNHQAEILYWSNAILIDSRNPYWYSKRAYAHLISGDRVRAVTDLATIINLYIYNDWETDQLFQWAVSEYARLEPQIEKYHNRSRLLELVDSQR